jgi:hypothetical protein
MRSCILSCILALVIALQVNGDTTPQVKTASPHLFQKWKTETSGPDASDETACAVAERERPRVSQLPDPFTPLSDLSCEQRLAKNERVVWEDDALMVLVDISGSALLVIPKKPKNFPCDLSDRQKAQVDRVAAASCDSLVLAGGGTPGRSGGTCRMYVSPPGAVSVRQMHVHVEANQGTNRGGDAAFFKDVSKRLRNLLGGNGCL